MSKKRTPSAAAPRSSLRPEVRPEAAAPETFHTVRRGDSLWSIAARMLGDGSRWPELAEANDLRNPDQIGIGQVLLIPVALAAPDPEATGADAPARASEQAKDAPSLGTAQEQALPPGVLADVGSATHETAYVVQRGDTLWEIATRYYDDPGRWKHVFATNGLSSDRLAVGQELLLTELPSRTLAFSFDPAMEVDVDLEVGAFSSSGPVMPGFGDLELTGDAAFALSAAGMQDVGAASPDALSPWEELPLPASARQAPAPLQAPAAPDTLPVVPSAPGPMAAVQRADEPARAAGEAPDLSAFDALFPASEGQFVVTDAQALIRSPPPQLASTGQVIEVGMQLEVIGRGRKGRRDYLHVVTSDGCVMGWTLAANCVPAKAIDPTLAASEGEQIPLEGLRGLQRAVANIYNLNGAYLRTQTGALGCSLATAVAILYVESGGKSFGNDGRMVLRFENHHFARHLGTGRRSEYDAHFMHSSWRGDTHKYRDTEDSEWRSVHNRGQAGEHHVLTLARGIDEDAALQSISMGAGQTLGSHYEMLGYDTPTAMWDAFDSGVKPQLDGVFDYIRSVRRCREAVKVPDYVELALGYNGSKALEHGYHTKLQRAATAFDEVKGSDLAPMTSPRPVARPAPLT